MMVDSAVIDDIKRRVSIATVIGRYTNLRPAGKNLVGLCPFHQEKSPSFSVNEAKGVFFCFGCQANGDVLGFLMKLRGLTFPEVLEDLAREAGVALPQRVVGPEWEERRDKKRRLESLQGVVAEFYHKVLAKSSTAEAARAYLADRAMDQQAIAEFQVGFAPSGWNTLVDFLRKKGLDTGLAAELGLIVKKNDYYDMFRNRIIFPIIDGRGHVIAFGGRSIDPEDKPKYLNSPETALFKKSQTLYGLSQAIPAIGREGYAIFVEGYVDVIALWQAGVRNVVAPLGTALTREHLDLIQRYAGSVVFLFDGDAAGEKAAERAVELVIDVGIPARMVMLEDKLDPDDYVRRHGAEKMRERLAAAEPLLGYFLQRSWEKTPKDAPGIAGWVRAALDTVARLRDPLERRLYLKTIAERSSFEEDNLRRQIASRLVKDSQERPPAAASPLRNLARFPSEEVMVIKLLLHYPRLTRAFREIRFVDKFSDPLLRRAAAILLESDAAGEADTIAGNDTVREFPDALYADEELANLINRLLVEGLAGDVGNEEVAGQMMLDAISVVFIRHLEEQVREKKIQLLRMDDAQLAGLTLEEVNRLQGLRETLRREPSLAALSRIQ
jgi:DNA primase